MHLTQQWYYMCHPRGPRTVHAAAFCSNCSFWILLKSHVELVSVIQLTDDYGMSDHVQESRSRTGRNWHTIWSCTKALLATSTTCSLGRSCESRRNSNLRFVWVSATPSRTKADKQLVPEVLCIHSYSILSGFSWTLLFPIHTPTSSRHWERATTASLEKNAEI